jgi:hypothetical protein
MRLMFILGVLALAAPDAALAQAQKTSPPGQPGVAGSSGGGAAAIAGLLSDGYDIKAAFVNANTSYVFLQKGTSAYMCKSAPSTCEKLN